MCGISGYALNEIPEKIDIIHDKLMHRGIDDSGIFKEKVGDTYVGFYHEDFLYMTSKKALLSQ